MSTGNEKALELVTAQTIVEASCLDIETAQQVVSDFAALPECDYCPSKLHTEQEQSKRLCRWCQQ